ncbi:MFS transporter [SAR202 cluster bacterium AD-804-J14_MRT_500m]|nr:MFS transporter [SAR202 cluster bacterium AD-804-J14_MRT_500m]
MNMLTTYKDVVNTPVRRQALVGLTVAYSLVQVASFPVALALPTIANDFLIDVETASWIMIAELLVLGSTVFLAAKLGDRHGHNRVFFVGIVISTFGAILAGLSQDFTQLVLFRGVQGLGAALIMGNANAILANYFPPDERGRAFAIPITGARMGTFIGLILFAVFLQFVGWRIMFYSFIPLGFFALWAALPLLKHPSERVERAEIPVDLVGAFLFIGAIGALILSGMHVHSGEESFTSREALSYHVPMHVLFLGLLAMIFWVERKSKHPFVDLGRFKNKQFSMALFSNVTFHLSMVAIMTLVPIMVENGFGYGPLMVLYVMLPHQSLGLVIPLVAGWYYDKYNSRMMRPIAMSLIALGILLLGVFSLHVPFWIIPLLLLPASIGTAVFNTVNNAVIMNALPQEQRGFASGMIETTRHVGHTMGATIAASALGLMIPAGINLLAREESYAYYLKGLQTSALAVVGIILAGSFVAFQHKTSKKQANLSGREPGVPVDGN